MRQITIRGIDPEVEKKVRKLARHRGTSINQIIKEIVHREFRPPETPPASSLKELAGGWTLEEVREFETAIEPCEQIDEEMWK